MNLIAAVDRNWGIGFRGKLLCRISTDLKRFRSLTLGHPVILGRKTLSSFPSGRPLPGRQNLILSRNPAFSIPEENAAVFHHLETLLETAPNDAFVIGGGEIYQLFLPFCQTAYLTKLDCAFPADTWFPNLDASPEWSIAQKEPWLEENHVRFQYVTYVRCPKESPFSLSC